MKNTELDVIYNLLLDMGLTLRKLTESSSKHESFFEKQKNLLKDKEFSMKSKEVLMNASRRK